MNIEELYKTKEGRTLIMFEIIKEDNLSITEIVAIKESAMNEKLSALNKLISGLAIRATTMFGIKPKDVLENIELVKPLVAKDILESGVVKGTKFEEELLHLINLPKEQGVSEKEHGNKATNNQGTL